VDTSSSAALLDQIDTFSIRALQASGLPAVGSPNGGSAALSAMGLVMHYTASDSFMGSVKWLCDTRSNASSHFVVSERREPAFESLMEGLPLVAALPATVLQLRSTKLRAYHATWANRWAVGVELSNVGEVRQTSESDHLWAPVAGVRWHKDRGVLLAGQRRFASFPTPQLQAAAQLCQALVKTLSIDPLRIVGHDMVQGAQTLVEGANGHDKRDVGGLCMHAWRTICQSDTAPRDQDLAKVLARQVDEAFYTRPSPDQMGSKVRLEALGYAVDTAYAAWSASERLSLGMFQVMMGLSADGICGPNTEAALWTRVQDRFLAPPHQAPQLQEAIPLA
jgi:N-acetyl-anhydromuramyl-L-alanine amidase AmpD